LHNLNVPAKPDTFILVSNKFDGYVAKERHVLNAAPKSVALTLLVNNPDGILVMAVNEKISVKDNACVEFENIVEGIVVIAVERIKFENISTSVNPI
jgi:hypothetical protein